MSRKKLIMPKGDGRLELAIQSLKIYYESNTWIKNQDFIERFLAENDDYDENTDTAMILHKARTARYFGLIKYLFKSQGNLSGRQGIITERGKRLYEAYQSGNNIALIDTLMEAIKRVSFGRNNYATSESDSDVEPPRVLIKAAYKLNFLTKNEFIYLMYGMHNLEKNFDVVINEISRFREKSEDSALPDDLDDKERSHFNNVYGDWKFIQLLREVGILKDLTDRVVLSDLVLEKYSDFIKNLSLTTSTPLEVEEQDLEALVKSDIIGDNILFYGVPGSGKSYEIKSKYCDNENLIERVVFHPDYTYSDFVGQILPQINEDGENSKVEYRFIPGPFTRILKACHEDINNGINQHRYLIIEEINRGNAPAIFGEIFQLLDRCDDSYKGIIGESEYGISNSDIAEEVYGDKNIKVKISSNLTILATMNTADQNVFTLDTAFKRRWKMKAIRNKFYYPLNENDEMYDERDKDIYEKHCNHRLCGTTISWKQFATKINDKIIEFGESNLSSEDSRLGVFFLKENEMDDTSIFSEKILMYLWNDAFKYNREDIFDNSYKTLEDLIDGFIENKFEIFKEDLGLKTIIELNNSVNEDSSRDEENV